MDRSIPMFNRLLSEKWLNEDLENHKSRLTEI